MQLAEGGEQPATALPPIVITGQGASDPVWEANRELDAARDENLLPKLGSSRYRLDAQTLQNLPQGDDTPLDKVLLRAPGVSYDSAVSNPDFHVRNEYANVQYRIDGVQLPEGVSGLGPVLDTGFAGRIELLDGVLPAQYGLRTAGVVDISSRTRPGNGGSVELSGGSRATLSSRVDVGGSADSTQYFLSARLLQSEEGLENAMPTLDPVHDRTRQAKWFAYGSTLLGDSARLVYLAGGSDARFQIPDVVGQRPLGDYGPATLSSSGLDENEVDQYDFGILALQTHGERADAQLSVFLRSTRVDFEPDTLGDLAFNDVASSVERRSLLEGLQVDTAVHLSAVQTLRAGLAVSAENTDVDDLSTVLPLAPDGAVLPLPRRINDERSLVGRNAGAYLQDEWRLQPALTLNAGVRFDYLAQFVTAAQWSPRLAMEYRPQADTTLHLGYARYFTPPMQAQATPNDLALFQGTTLQPAIDRADPLRPERAHYLDLGGEFWPSAELLAGLDVYAKRATGQLDDGQFGQAVVLTQFNYARGYSHGVEAKLEYGAQGVQAYLHASANVTRAQQPVSNQYLFTDPAEFAYVTEHYIYTDDEQRVSASAGASRRWGHWLASVDGLFGSGLRSGFANLQHAPGYLQGNLALARSFELLPAAKPLTVRASVVNVFDRSYLLRTGTGIGEFAPQYGPRRGFFLGVTQAF